VAQPLPMFEVPPVMTTTLPAKRFESLMASLPHPA
jgi:hypothetical protein